LQWRDESLRELGRLGGDTWCFRRIDPDRGETHKQESDGNAPAITNNLHFSFLRRLFGEVRALRVPGWLRGKLLVRMRSHPFMRKILGFGDLFAGHRACGDIAEPFGLLVARYPRRQNRGLMVSVFRISAVRTAIDALQTKTSPGSHLLPPSSDSTY
jgi:hypothetical protein